MSKQKLQRIAMAFILNNDPEEVNKSLRRMYRMAEKSKNDLTPQQWGNCKLYMAEIDFLLKALATVSQKVVNSFGVKMQGKSREEVRKEIEQLNRELYYTNLKG